MALRRRKDNPEGRMSLGDHLRELRRRLTISALAVVAGAVVGWIKYAQLLDIVLKPLRDFVATRSASSGSLVSINYGGLTDPFAAQLNVSIFVGLVLASPVWLLQLWLFIVPGLTRKEKRVSAVFIAAAVPLFLAGMALAYIVIPHAIVTLLGFTPQNASNIIAAMDYLNFVLKFVLAFGLAFLLPVFMIGLNIAGIMPASRMIKAWRPAVMIIFVFAAIMTPTPDPWSMLAVASPMVILYFAAVGVAKILDRIRKRQEPAWMATPDDQASAI